MGRAAEQALSALRLALLPRRPSGKDGRGSRPPEHHLGDNAALTDQAFADFADIGFTAVKADVPEGMTATEYADRIGSYGLAPS